MIKFLVAPLLVTAAFSTHAQSAGMYSGAEVNHNRISGVGSSTGFGAFGGYRFGNGAAVEVGLNRIGRYTIENTAKFSLNHISVSGIYNVPINDSVGVYGRLGFGSFRVSLKDTLVSKGVKVDNNLLFGIGLNYQVTPEIGVRGEFRKPASDVSSFGVGVHYQF